MLCQDGSLYSLSSFSISGEPFDIVKERLVRGLMLEGGIAKRKIIVCDQAPWVQTILNHPAVLKAFSITTVTAFEIAVDSLLKDEYDICLFRISGPGAIGSDILRALNQVKVSTRCTLLILESQPEWREIYLSYSTSQQISKTTHDNLCRRVLEFANHPAASQTTHSHNVLILSSLNEFLEAEDLTSREIQVCALRAKGKSCKEIAIDLNISTLTVYAYSRSVAKKISEFRKRIKVSRSAQYSPLNRNSNHLVRPINLATLQMTLN